MMTALKTKIMNDLLSDGVCLVLGLIAGYIVKVI